MKNWLIILIAIIVISLVGVGAVLIARNYTTLPNNNRVETNDNTTTNELNSYPVSSNDNSIYSNTELEIFKSPDGLYEFSYPSSWSFANNREGKGLYPIDDNNFVSGNIELITIAYIDAGNNVPDPKEVVVVHYGSDYSKGENLIFNSYPAFKAEYIRKSYTDIAISLVHENKFIQALFRIRDNTTGANYDYSKYLKDFNTIVESVKFN